MTREQLENLKIGDKVKATLTGKIYTLESKPIFAEYKITGKDFLWLENSNGNPDNVLMIPFFFDELELVESEARKCNCDIMSLMRVGCTCNGV